jgi:hypothetical protein
VDRRFTTKELTQVRKDWIGYFPEYGQFVKNGKKMNRFDKRVGPLLVSVWLDATRKDDYRPHFSVHHLLRHADYTSPELNTELKKRWRITPKQHEEGIYLEAIEELKKTAPMPVEGPLRLSDILEAYRKNEAIYHLSEIEGPALIAGWCGKVNLANELINEFYKSYKEHYRALEEVERTEGELTPEEWKEDMRRRVADKDGLDRMLEEEIKKHNIDQFPSYELIVDEENCSGSFLGKLSRILGK